MITPDQLWNQTYAERLTPHVESALNTAFERIAQRPPKYPDNCGVMCRRVHNHLSALGVKSHILSGQFTGGLDMSRLAYAPASREHVWLDVEGAVVDPTAGQFRDEFKGDFDPSHYVRD